VTFVIGGSACHIRESVDKAKAAVSDGRMFAGPPGPKSYACFVRLYDANQMAQHPKQKVSAMKLSVTAEAEDKTIDLGFRYRHCADSFDSSGHCSRIVAENSGGEIRLGCGVDCEGGGIEVAMKDHRSALIRLERIRIWERNKVDDDVGDDLVAGADDRIFERADLHECSELVTDRKELAALRRN
jgi:hypothetical protein